MFSATKECEGHCPGKGEMPSFPHANPKEEISIIRLISSCSSEGWDEATKNVSDI
jgi:hypothetical protein